MQFLYKTSTHLENEAILPAPTRSLVKLPALLELLHPFCLSSPPTGSMLGLREALAMAALHPNAFSISSNSALWSLLSRARFPRRELCLRSRLLSEEFPPGDRDRLAFRSLPRESALLRHRPGYGTGLEQNTRRGHTRISPPSTRLFTIPSPIIPTYPMLTLRLLSARFPFFRFAFLPFASSPSKCVLFFFFFSDFLVPFSRSSYK